MFACVWYVWCVHVRVGVGVCECVCVRERERETERKRVRPYLAVLRIRNTFSAKILLLAAEVEAAAAVEQKNNITDFSSLCFRSTLLLQRHKKAESFEKRVLTMAEI